MDSRAPHSLTVYRESLALCELSEALVIYFSYDKQILPLSFRDDMIQAILTDTVLITRKVELAALSNSHTVRIESMIFVNIMIRNIEAYCNGLEKDGIKEKEYLNLLRRAVKSFSNTFERWCRSFC